MALGDPPAAIVQPNVGSLVNVGRPVVEPRATQALTDAFRNGFITADDVLSRVGEKAQLQQQAEKMALQEQTSPEMQEARKIAMQAATARGKQQIREAAVAEQFKDLFERKTKSDLISAIEKDESLGQNDKMAAILGAVGEEVPRTEDGFVDPEKTRNLLRDVSAWRRSLDTAAANIAVKWEKRDIPPERGGGEELAPFSPAKGRFLTSDEYVQAQRDAQQAPDFQTWRQRQAALAAQPAVSAVPVAEAAPAAPLVQPISNAQASAETDAQRNLRMQLFNREGAGSTALSDPIALVESRIAAPAAPAAPAATAMVQPKTAAVVMQPAQITLTKSDKPDAGRLIPAEAMSKFIQLRLAKKNLADVEAAYDEVKRNSPGLTGPIAGRTIGPLVGQWDVPYQKLENATQAAVPGMARGVFGEVGVLSDNDIKNYKKLMPSVTDTEAVAEAKMNAIRTKVAKADLEFAKTFKEAGYNPGELIKLIDQGKVTPENVNEVAIPTAGATAPANVVTLSSGKRVTRDPKTGAWVSAP